MATGEASDPLVREPHGWVAFFGTDPAASVAGMLEAVADRFRLETAFRDAQQVVGAGQQQVRKLATNVWAFPVFPWTSTQTEAWAWGRPAAGLAERSGSPWDDPERRPSHADKRRGLRREVLAAEIQRTLQPGLTEKDYSGMAERLLRLAA